MGITKHRFTQPSRRVSALALGLSFFCGIAAFGCSDNEDGEGDGSVTGDDDIMLGSNDPNAIEGFSGPRDGGRVDLSEEEVTNIAKAACTGWAGEGENLPAVLQLVVDMSSSMSAEAPGSNRSKWEETRDALEAAIVSLPAAVSVGMLFYPNTDTQRGNASGINACVNTEDIVPITMLGGAMSEARTTLIDALNEANLNTGTPTFDAYTHALEASLLPYETSSNKFMLLITDGAPTIAGQCTSTGGQGMGGFSDAPTQPIVDEVEAAFVDHNIRTFLIGSPGSEESSMSDMDMRPWLSEAAVLGGTAEPGCEEAGPQFCHMDMTQEPNFAQALSSGLAAIAGQIIDSCTFKVPTPPEGQNIAADKTNLIVRWGDGNASLILPDNVDDCGDGWQFNAKGEVVLCGETCDEVKLDHQASVSLTFGCSVDEIVAPVK